MAEPALANSGQPCPAARIRWEGQQCHSIDTGDRYFSPDGDREVWRVFMAPVQLADRFARATGTFTCGELGFGTGLNLAVLATQFCKLADPAAQLHLISFEHRPLTQADMASMANRWQDQLPVYQELSEQYPPLISGWHRLHLCGGRVRLSVFFGDALGGLHDITGRQQRPVDHWLLDGFAPAVNPELWQASVFRQLIELSAGGTTIATYSAVGEVRRTLAGLGFQMRKVDQMPLKLHSLAGELVGRARSVIMQPRRVSVVGSGIAGATIARALAERNIPVAVIEPAGRVAGQASRIPAAALHGRLRWDQSAGAAWQVLSYHYSHRRLNNTPGYRPTGVLQITGPNADPERLEALFERYAPTGDWLEHRSLSDSPAGRWSSAPACIEFAIGGVVRGPTLIRALLDHPLISLHTNPASVDRARVTVLANGVLARSHDAARYLELAALPGQAELCAHPAPPAAPIVGAGYMAPCRGGMVVGATYEYRDWQPGEAQAVNLERWLNTGVHRGSFRAARTITSDRLAIVGALFSREGEMVSGLRVATGFGSSGMSSAPLAAECIAAELAGEFAPVTRELGAALSSERFRKRQARRGLRMGAQH